MPPRRYYIPTPKAPYPNRGIGGQFIYLLALLTVLVLAVPALHPKNLLLRSTGKTMDSLPPPVQAAALKIWDYMILGHVLPERVSLIMALGSNDPRVAERAADLYLEGRAPLILFSGGGRADGGPLRRAQRGGVLCADRDGARRARGRHPYGGEKHQHGGKHKI